jgi:arginyl-tRNA synthetase
MIPSVIEECTQKGMVELSDGAKCIFLENFKIPLMVQKSDGGFNYDSTDMAAIKYRIFEQK